VAALGDVPLVNVRDGVDGHRRRVAQPAHLTSWLSSFARVGVAGTRHTVPVRVAALLRGINIGPSKRISMPALREIVESLGHRDVETYLQSGNVVFTPGKAVRSDLAPAIEAAIEDATGLEVPVLIRTGRQLADVVSANPYTVDDPTRIVVAFLGEAVEPSRLGLGDLASYAPDDLTQIGCELFISVPNGQGRSKLMEALTKRRMPTVVTVRNWRTVVALADMTA
jgi:uncharacterized protein (DUF1697 family)